MKTLLLILLPFVGMCQNAVINTPLTLNDLFIGYKKECYADSSIIEVNVNNYPEYNDVQSHTLEYRIPVYKKQWIHRQPTFEGFMDYVEKFTSK